MRWRGRRQSSNIEDRRGRPSGGFSRGRIRLPVRRRGQAGSGRGRPSLLFLVIAGGALWFMGVSPATIVSLLTGSGDGLVSQSPQHYERQAQGSGGAHDDMKQFIGVVLAETEDVWGEIFRKAGERYQEPRLVLFSDRVRSVCGAASSATGPFYCPGDKQIYIDLGFYRELKTRYEAPGDFAQAYVVAHEVGHHVQNIIGVLPKFNQMRRSLSTLEANRMSIRVELQADCFAGVWAHFTNQKGLLERGDVEEALNAATQIGDDALQRRAQGYVVPDSFNHGTSAQRKKWFARGFRQGDMKACDTFGVANP